MPGAGGAAAAGGAAEVLTVLAGGAALALPAATVREVLRPAPVTRVPHAPASLLGLSNLRGAVLPVLSLARLVAGEGASPAAPPATSGAPAARVVVVEGAATVGLLVDAVSCLGGAGTARRVDLPALLARDFGGMLRAAVRPAAPAAAGRDGEGRDGEAGEEGGGALALLVFVVAGQEHALPVDKVLEVARLPAEVTALPREGEAVGEAAPGVVPFRGGLLPLVPAHALLGLPAAAPGPGSRVVVVRHGAAQVGLVVDGMRAILRVAPDALDPVPAVLARRGPGHGGGEARVEAIARVEGGRRLVAVLSPAGLFEEATAARPAEGGPGGVAGDMAGGTMEGARDGAGDAGATERFVVFRLGDEHYGLPIAAVDEVVRRPATLTRIPRAPAFVEGAMNLRGAVVPVIDQRRRFGSPEAGTGQGTGQERVGRVIVVTVGGVRAGFAVDAVSEVMAVAAADLLPAPDLAGPGPDAGEGTARVFDRVARVARDGRVILLIDPRALLDAAERDLLAAVASPGRAKADRGP